MSKKKPVGKALGQLVVGNPRGMRITDHSASKDVVKAPAWSAVDRLIDYHDLFFNLSPEVSGPRLWLVKLGAWLINAARLPYGAGGRGPLRVGVK